MSATQNEIKNWLEEGKKRKATHVIIALDTWDYSNYPVYVSSDQDVRSIISSYDSKQDRIDEVYDLSLSIPSQLQQGRAWNL